MAVPKTPKLFSDLGIGLGLRTSHYSDIREQSESGQVKASNVKWFEAISENYMEDGGRAIHRLTEVRKDRPIALHGVSLSIASVDPLNDDYLKRLKKLVDRIEPAVVSDHCCWTGFNGENLHDLMPVPFTREAIDHIAQRVIQVQERLGRRILLENVSSYVSFKHSEMTEWEFLNELVRKADCGLLLDVNNVYVSAINHGFNAFDYIQALPPERVGQIHLAGHSERESDDGTRFLIDTHDAAVCDDVWELFDKTVQHLGPVSTMVEWDGNIPSYARLEEEVMKAKIIQERKK